MVNGWKITAVIFILLFLVETGVVIYFINYSLTIVDNETKCQSDICYGKQADTYVYDSPSRICYCYNNAGNEIYREVLK